MIEERKRYKLIIALLTVLSIIYNLVLRDVSLSVGFSGVIFQFLGSMLVGFVFSRFSGRYSFHYWMKWWSIVFTIMVVGGYVYVFLEGAPS